LLRKFHTARQSGLAHVVVWGSGTPRREFLHVDDLAAALLFLMQHYNGEELVNVGTGEDLPILDLARLVSRVVGFEGEIMLDPSKPDGTPRKLLDVSPLLELGWSPRIGLEAGIRSTYQWFVANERQLRAK
jgi:GDP-L-fucose synthase